MQEIMSFTTTNNAYKNTLIKAYYYIILADGVINEKELAFGEKMIRKEDIDQNLFNKKMKSFESEKLESLIVSLKSDLKKLKKEEQIKIIAYMSNVANSDGFMDQTEWKMIYDLYKNELNLQLEDILQAQKTIPPFQN